MFDIGFTELMLIATVALLVAGSENLPRQLREAGRWYAQLRSRFSELKADIEDKIGADEIREQLRMESIREGFEKDKETLKSHR